MHFIGFCNSYGLVVESKSPATISERSVKYF